MRWLLILAWMGSAEAQPEGVEVPAGAPGEAGEAAPATRRMGPPISLADDPESPLALAAYNKGRYDEAAQRFLTLVQRWPREPAPYRALARARVWAGDPTGAVRAYRIYLDLSPDASDRDKIDAELKLARRKAGPQATEGPVPAAVHALAQAAPRALAGTFSGPAGAFAALDSAEDLGYLGPDLADARDQVFQALIQRADGAIDRWWRPEAQASVEELKDLLKSFDDLKRRRPLSQAEVALPGALEGLLALAETRGEDAARFLAEVAPGDPRLRFAQAIALLQGGRAEEAEALLTLLQRTESDPRVSLLLGLTRRLLGKDDAVEALKQALLE